MRKAVGQFLWNKTHERGPQGMRLQRLLSIVSTSTRYHDNLNIELFLCPSESQCIGWRLGRLKQKEGFQIFDRTLFADFIIYRFKLTIVISYFQETKIKKCKTVFHLNAAQRKPWCNSEGIKWKFLKRKWQIIGIALLYCTLNKWELLYVFQAIIIHCIIN